MPYQAGGMRIHGRPGRGKMRCEYCGKLQPASALKRGAVFGHLICKDRRACDQRKAAQ